MRQMDRSGKAFSMLPPLLGALLGVAFFLHGSGTAGLRAEGGGDAEGLRIIQKMDDLFRGKTSSHSQATMVVHRPRWDREMEMESWEDRAIKASFVRILSPPGDAGTSFLKQGDALRQYIPKIQRTIRISKSMMLTSWMGSDFTNDDLVRESSMIKDYLHSAPAEAKCGTETCWSVTLMAKKEAPVVWPKIEAMVRKDYAPFRFTYINQRGEALKRMDFSDYRPVEGRIFPMEWTMVNLREEGNSTLLKFKHIEFDRGVSRSIFTERNLTRGR